MAIEIIAIISHRLVSGVLELKVEYNNDEHHWYHIELVLSEDPQATAQYVIHNDLGKVFDYKYCRWDRAFLLSSAIFTVSVVVPILVLLPSTLDLPTKSVVEGKNIGC